MNKLVSRNPVLRFKEGRKILKMKFAGTIQTSQLTSGTKVGKYTRKADRFNGPLLWYDENGNPITKRVQLLYDGYNYSLNPNGTYSRGKIIPLKSDTDFLNSESNLRLLETMSEIPLNKKITPKTKKTVKDWDTEFLNNFTNTLTQALRAYLDSKGVDYSKASNVLEFLMKLLKTDLGGYKNDGKWGTNSINAWKDFVTNNIPDYISSPTLPTSEQLILQVTQNVPVVEEVPLAGTDSIQNLLMAMLEATKQGILPATGTYIINPTLPKANRSDIREVIRRATGKGAYDFTGALRKALRLYINGEQYNADDLAAFGNLDIFNAYKPGFYKQGGNMLPSRNIVERFKLRNFLVSGPVTTLKTGGNIPKLLNGGYTVKKGDTLSVIAKLKGISLLKLLSWNKEIKDPNKINIGLNITIKESPIPEISKRPDNKYVPYQFKSTEKFTPSNNTTKTTKKIKQQPSTQNIQIKQKELPNVLLNIKSKGKGLLLRLFGDKDIITGRTLSELKKYDAKYNTPYSLEMDKGEPVMEPYDFYGLTLYRVKLSGPEGRPEYRSKLGDLGLYNRQVDKNGNVCYKIKNDKGQIVTQCAETANLINRALNLPTTGDAWTRHGVYGDSLIYGGENHNKIYTRQLSKVLNGINPSNIDPNNLKSGDFVDLMRDTKLGGKNDKLAAEGRGNTHTGTIFKPYGDKGPAYIVHNIGGPVYVDPLGKFGSLNTWSIMGIRRPGSKEHPYNK